MLRAKVLPQILAQANTNGVKATILLNEEGSLLASTGEESSQVIVAAIVSNVWAQYSKLNDQSLEYMLLEQEKGRVVVTKVSTLLLCIYGDKSAEFGMLKRKAHILRDYLQEPLQQVF